MQTIDSLNWISIDTTHNSSINSLVSVVALFFDILVIGPRQDVISARGGSDRPEPSGETIHGLFGERGNPRRNGVEQVRRNVHGNLFDAEKIK